MLFQDLSQTKVFIKPGPTDMRKSINGLSIIAKKVMQENPYNDQLFVFCNRKRDRIKILYWDKNGFSLWLKWLDKHKYPWPKSEEQKQLIDIEKLKMILTGIDFFNAHQRLEYKKV